MPILSIVKYGSPVLGQAGEAITRFDDELRQLVDNMVKTMYAAPGVGLAAQQVGLALRLAVIDITVGEDPDALLVLVNPEIVATEGEQVGEEGCLSVPGFSETVKCPEMVEIKAQDIAGNEWTKRGEGLLARAFLHETDHINGHLYFERLPTLRRSLFVRRLRKKIRREPDWNA